MKQLVLSIFITLAPIVAIQMDAPVVGNNIKIPISEEAVIMPFSGDIIATIKFLIYSTYFI